MGDRGTDTTASKAFDYPAKVHVRKHGPEGYEDYESYRDWLRDEFLFRCAACLDREKWIGLLGKFHIDHIHSQVECPERRLDYDNLVYLCASCNLVKPDKEAPDPCSLPMGECLSVSEDGRIHPLNDQGQIVINAFRLDSRDANERRALVLDAIRCLKNQGKSLVQWLGFPSDLPDLRQMKPPSNTRPEGLDNCFYVLRERGRIPEIY